jgi:hypothetical protein
MANKKQIQDAYFKIELKKAFAQGKLAGKKELVELAEKKWFVIAEKENDDFREGYGAGQKAFGEWLKSQLSKDEVR